jgi:DNA-binding NarL/FixJ family response regulator
MRSTTPANRSLTLAACAVAVAAAVSPAQLMSQDEAVDQIQRYCSSSWQRAGIAHQDWEDCTQETIVELLDRIGAAELPAAISDPASQQRQELKRCIWCIAKRWQRSARPGTYDEAKAAQQALSAQAAYSWDEVLGGVDHLLSRSQSQILRLLAEGWGVADVADQLQLSTVQVSRAKYKALRKLRDALAELS